MLSLFLPLPSDPPSHLFHSSLHQHYLVPPCSNRYLLASSFFYYALCAKITSWLAASITGHHKRNTNNPANGGDTAGVLINHQEGRVVMFKDLVITREPGDDPGVKE